MEPTIEDESTIIEDYDEKIKIMLMGDSDVGKTSLLKKYCENEFSNSYITTVGIDFKIQYLTINNKKIKLQIWDTAGEERYRIVAKNYLNSSDGFLILYDITRRESFDNVNNWIEQIVDVAENHSYCIIVGNKYDLKDGRQVNVNEGKELAKKNKYEFFETSAKDGYNIKEVFESLTRKIMNKLESSKTPRRTTISLSTKTHKKKINNNCC